MQLPTNSQLPEQYSNFVTLWETNLINDTSIHMHVMLQQGSNLTDVYISTSIMVRELFMLNTIPQSAYLKARYQTIERAVYTVCYQASLQLNVDRSFFRYGAPPLPVMRQAPLERDTGDYQPPPPHTPPAPPATPVTPPYTVNPSMRQKRLTKDLRQQQVAGQATYHGLPYIDPKVVERAVANQRLERERNGQS